MVHQRILRWDGVNFKKIVRNLLLKMRWDWDDEKREPWLYMGNLRNLRLPKLSFHEPNLIVYHSLPDPDCMRCGMSHKCKKNTTWNTSHGIKYMVWNASHDTKYIVWNASHGMKCIAWYEIHRMKCIARYKMHRMVQNTSHGMKCIAWYKMHRMVQNTSHGMKCISW
jgi:hypothetical protein